MIRYFLQSSWIVINYYLWLVENHMQILIAQSSNNMIW